MRTDARSSARSARAALALLSTCGLALFPAPPAAAQEPAADAPCRITGRLVDEGGAPVAGARLTLHGWVANSDRALAHGVPASWRDPEAVESDADGRFALELVPPRAFQFTLDVERRGFGKVGWRWGALAPGAALDLGETVLEPPAVVVGHLVDAAGNLLVEGWRVGVWHNWNSGLGGRSAVGTTVGVLPSAGTFRVDDLPPGRLRINAWSTGGASVPETWIDARSGEVHEVELVYEGPDERARLLVSVSVDRFHPFRLAPGTARAVAADGTVRELVPTSAGASGWQATDVPPGAYRIEIDDPRFEPWRKEGALPGQRVRATLVGSAALRLTVRPAADAAPLTAYGLRATWLGVNFGPSTFALAADGSLAPPDGLFPGLVPGDLELELRAPDRPPQRVRVPALAPGETREVEVVLAEALALRGRVLRADGGPAAGVRVQLTRGEVAGHDGPAEARTVMAIEGRTVTVRYRDAKLRTDADGRFAFEELAPDVYALRALDGPYATADAVVELAAGAPEPTLTLPAVGALALELALPAGVAVERLGVIARPGGAGHPAPPFVGPGQPLAADGTCRIERLPAGEVALALRIEHGAPGTSWREVRLGVAQVVAGSTVPHVADVRERLGGLIEVRADLVGRAAQGVEVRLVGPDGRVERSSRGQLHGTATVRLDAPPGTWLVRLDCAPGGWSWEHPEPVTLAPAGAVAVEVAVPRIARALRVVAPDGTPRGDLEVSWWRPGLPPGSARATTDGAGRLPLELPPGRYTLARAADAARARVRTARFEWAAGDGPLEVTLRDGD